MRFVSFHLSRHCSDEGQDHLIRSELTCTTTTRFGRDRYHLNLQLIANGTKVITVDWDGTETE